MGFCTFFHTFQRRFLKRIRHFVENCNYHLQRDCAEMSERLLIYICQTNIETVLSIEHTLLRLDGAERVAVTYSHVHAASCRKILQTCVVCRKGTSSEKIKLKISKGYFVSSFE
jgi:hypothetical protein